VEEKKKKKKKKKEQKSRKTVNSGKWSLMDSGNDEPKRVGDARRLYPRKGSLRIREAIRLGDLSRPRYGDHGVLITKEKRVEGQGGVPVERRMPMRKEEKRIGHESMSLSGRGRYCIMMAQLRSDQSAVTSLNDLYTNSGRHVRNWASRICYGGPRKQPRAGKGFALRLYVSRLPCQPSSG
jgi:hypothetical protein